jgi:hypothetical protein
VNASWKIAAAALAISASTAVALGQQKSTPAFKPEEFFNGSVTGKGTITKLFFWSEEFTNEFSGEIRGDETLIEERFTFEDSTPKQYWRFQRQADGRYSGDVTTEGEDGRLRGPLPVDAWLDAGGFHLDYVGHSPDGGDTQFRFRHDLTLQPDGTVTNDVSISWWGIPLASSRAVFSRQPVP